MFSTSRARCFLALLLLAFAPPAFSNDLVSANALPIPNADLRFLKHGAITVQENLDGDLLLAPNAGCSEIEPNESAAQATPMTLPASCTGAAASFDAGNWIVTYTGGATDDIEDLWKIVLGSAGTVTASATFSSSGDLDIFLFRISGSSAEPLANSSATGGTSESFTKSVTAGTYYVGVSAYTGSSSYTINVSATGQGTVTVNAPSNLQAQATSSSVIRLTWNDNSNNEDEFRVEQKNLSNAWVDIGGVSANSTAVNVTGFSAGETGTFRVRARAGSVYSSYSNEASATTSGGGSPCFANSTTVCLLNDRFRVSIAYFNPIAQQYGTFMAGRLMQGPQNPDVGLFGFSSPQAIEIVVRIQDVRPFANRFDVYYGGMTDFPYTVTVTDTQTGTTRQYVFAGGVPAGGVDRTSFPTN